MAIETYKFRLYPTDGQKVLLAKHFGHVRFVYNWALEKCETEYKSNVKFKGWMSIIGGGDFMRLKEANPWLYEVNSQSMVNAVAHLGRAFDNFFKNKGGYPKFKSKFNSRQSFEVPAGFKIDFKAKKIQLPKFVKTKTEDNRIPFVLSRKVKKGKFGTATVSRDAAGKYYVSFIVHTEEKLPNFSKDITKDNSVGIDFGLKHFLTFSNGEVVDSPEFYKRSLAKLRKVSRNLSHKKKGSKNRNKARLRVAKLHQHIANQREDFLHKLTTRLVEENQFDVFCLEDLNLKGMSKLWGRKVHDLSQNTFVSMLSYKCMKHGKKLVKIGRFDPSSQICSSCGHRQRMPLEERTYLCPECGMSLDRDVNAAINIRDFAVRRFLEESLQNTDGTSGINACGEETSSPGAVKADGSSLVSEAGIFPISLGNPSRL